MKVGTYIGGGLVLGGAATAYVLRMKRFAKSLESAVSAGLPGLGKGVRITLRVLLKNPTSISMRIKYPELRLYLNGLYIGGSETVNRDIDIPKFGEALIEGLTVSIKPVGIAILGNGFLFNVGRAVNLKVETITTVYPVSFLPVPHNTEDIIPLKKGKDGTS